jgi:NTE family protein
MPDFRMGPGPSIADPASYLAGSGVKGHIAVTKVSRIVRSVRAFARGLTREVSVEPPKRPAIGLALGGGFARGLAHIGVLKVLEENHIPIDFVAGTSVGSVVGAMYCSGVSSKELEEISRLVRFKDFARWTISLLGFASNDRMAQLLERFLKVKTFEELRIPLAVSATDFVTGEAATFRSGPLVDAVRASCAYPGMFLPVEVNGRLLVDGMLAHAVPTEPVRELGAERVIAVYLSANWVNLNGPRHVFDVIGQCFSIAQQRMCNLWQPAADLILQPDVRGFSYDSFDHAAELIVAGENAAREALPMLRSWIGADTPAAQAVEVATTQKKTPKLTPAAAPVQS